MLALLILAVQLSVPLFVKDAQGYSGWLFFALILSRFIGIYHPPAAIEEPLDFKRQALAWLTLIIFIISASPAPIRLG